MKFSSTIVLTLLTASSMQGKNTPKSARSELSETCSEDVGYLSASSTLEFLQEYIAVNEFSRVVLVVRGHCHDDFLRRFFLLGFYTLVVPYANDNRQLDNVLLGARDQPWNRSCLLLQLFNSDITRPSMFPELPWLILGPSFPASAYKVRLPVNNQVVFAILKELLPSRTAPALTDTAEDLPDRAQRAAGGVRRDAKAGGVRNSPKSDGRVLTSHTREPSKKIEGKEADDNGSNIFKKKCSGGKNIGDISRNGAGSEHGTEEVLRVKRGFKSREAAEQEITEKLRGDKPSTLSSTVPINEKKASTSGTRTQETSFTTKTFDNHNTTDALARIIRDAGSVRKKIVKSDAIPMEKGVQNLVTLDSANGTERKTKRTISGAVKHALASRANGAWLTVELWESYTVTDETPVVQTRLFQWTPSVAVPPLSRNLSERRMDLLGARLKCITEQQAPGVRIEQTAPGKLSIFGWVVDLVRALQSTMNFTCSMSRPPDHEFGALSPDGAWSGLVGEVTAGRADVITASLDNTHARSAAIDFLIAIDVTGYIMVMRPTGQLGSAWTNYTSEFSFGVWICLAVLICAGSVVLYVARSRSPLEDTSITFAEACTTALAAITSQSYECVTTALSGRTAWITLLLTAVVITAHYNCWLYSTLAVNVPGYPFDGFQSLLDKSSYTLGLVRGFSVETEFMESKDRTIQRVWRELVYPQGLVESTDEGIRKAREEGFVFLIVESEFYGSDINPCDFTVLPRNFFKFPAGFAVQRGSPLGPIFNKALIQMMNTGVLRRTREKWSRREPDCRSVNLGAITLKQMVSAFCFLAAGCTLALLICSSEILFKWKSRRRIVARARRRGVV